MKNISKNVVLWIIIGLLLIVLFNLFQGTSNNRSTSKISFSDFIAATESGNVSEVNIAVVVSNASINWSLDFLYAPDARRWWKSNGLW